tara:strand:- start:471 stop:1205 length:735 start_codon:yes stop_codon:yes gene_type:complete
MKINLNKIFKDSWKLFSQNFLLLISMISIILFVSGLMNIILSKAVEGSDTQRIVFSIASNLFNMGITLGSIRIIINIIQEKPARLIQLFENFHLLGHYLLGSLIFGFILFASVLPLLFFSFKTESILGLLKNIIGGELDESIKILFVESNPFVIFLIFSIVIIVAIRVQFYPYFIILKESNPIDALIGSFNITKTYFNSLFVLGIILMLINLLGILFFGIGLFFTLPFSMLTLGIMFYRLNLKY